MGKIFGKKETMREINKIKQNMKNKNNWTKIQNTEISYHVFDDGSIQICVEPNENEPAISQGCYIFRDEIDAVAEVFKQIK